jgi:Coenzyme PQQ synthesis protein D (PqqD)
MPLLSLADHAIFDTTDGTGVILDTRSGIYFGLNDTATVMLEAGLSCETVEETIARLAERIEGSADTLRTGVETLAALLRARELLQPSAAGAS